MNKRSTINDVAKLAGVSITTVSRVINDNYPVSEKTKKKVNTAIEALGFRPNLLARSLIQDKTQTIGIITPSIENLFFSEVIKGIDDYVGYKDYRSFLCNTEGNALREKEMIDSLLNRSVDGIIVIDPRSKNIKNGFYEGISKRLPLVLINGYSEGIMCNFILNDDVTGTLTALRRFKHQGRERIGLLLGQKSYSYDIKENVYLDFLQKENLQIEPTILRIQGSNSLESCQQAKECLLQHMKNNEQPLDAILCGNDFMAVGALHAARSLGIEVPKALSIIGFDNSLISQISYPPLTTVDHQMVELGTMAAKRMVALINDPDFKDHTQKISVATHLIERDT